VEEKEQTDREEVKVKQDHGDLHVIILPGEPRGEGDEDDKDENDEVEPENAGIDRAEKMEQTVVERPVRRKQEERDKEAGKYRQHPCEMAGELCCGLCFWNGRRDHKVYDKERHRKGKHAVNERFEPAF